MSADSLGGGGGGGWGGGGGAGGSSDGDLGAGGGGGGSWARQATVDDSDAPVLGEDAPPTTASGSVVLTFDICYLEPTLSYCDALSATGAVSAQARIQRLGSLLWVALLGTTEQDVRRLRTERFTLGDVDAKPRWTSPPFDLDRDGFDDLLLVFRVSDVGRAAVRERICLAALREDGIRLEACAIPTGLWHGWSKTGRARVRAFARQLGRRGQ